MKYSEIGFRNLYHKFCMVPLTDQIKEIAQRFPEIEKANSLLAYGYIDHEAGMTLEVIAAGKRGLTGYKFFDTNPSVTAKIRIGSIENENITLYTGDIDKIKSRYIDKVEHLSVYDTTEDVEITRGFSILDACRHPHYPDDIQVYLLRENMNIEVCWARMTGLGEHSIKAVLLNEPDQEYGCHEGDVIDVLVQKMDDDTYVCLSDQN